MPASDRDEKVTFAREEHFRESVSRLFVRVEARLRTLLPFSDIRHVGSDGISFEDVGSQPPLGVHLTVIDGTCDIQWRFRELLVASAALRQEYDDLKRRFDGGSMAEYREAKAAFVERALRDWVER